MSGPHHAKRCVFIGSPFYINSLIPPIDRFSNTTYRRLIKGDYDYRDWSADGASLVGLVLIGVLHWIGDLGWWTSIGSGLAAAMALGIALSHWQKRCIRARVLIQ